MKEQKGNAPKFVGTVVNFLNRGWDYVIGPSKARCNAYSSQINYAQQQMRRDNLSRKEKRFWRRERDDGMNGLASVHATNNDTFVKLVAVGAGLLFIIVIQKNKT